MTLQVIPVKFQKEVESNDDLVDLILESFEINDDDILVFSQKIISKNEDRILKLSSVITSEYLEWYTLKLFFLPRLINNSFPAFIADRCTNPFVSVITSTEKELLSLHSKHSMSCLGERKEMKM